MPTRHDLSTLAWTLTGSTPFQWLLGDPAKVENDPAMEVLPIPARVPGSVQQALRSAGLLPDWNEGQHARECEWVENRHWIYQARLPDDWFQSGTAFRLRCLGLDYSGWVYLNGKKIASFRGTHLPHSFELSSHLAPAGNLLQIVFDVPPRWLGQFGYTSQMTEWKPRYYYTWDWTARLVQSGIWDTIWLEALDEPQLGELDCQSGIDTSGQGWLQLAGPVQAGPDARVQLRLADEAGVLREQNLPAADFEHGLAWTGLAVKRWYPNGLGEQALYDLTVRLLDGAGGLLEQVSLKVGFKQVEWRACAGAPQGADPWICAVNGQALFLQGFNWTPILPNFADLTGEDYRTRLLAYREMGCNILRVWGGGFLEKEIFYQLCDQLGLMVWQELPLSSSGIDNWPPEDEASLAALSEIATSFMRRRRGHVSLLLWGGGNELQGGLDGGKEGVGIPVTLAHPLIQRFAEIAAREDPQRRFVASSPSGPRFSADPREIGKGLHWDVHGPWKADPDLARWDEYWQAVDGLIHSEVGAPGASSAELIRRFRGDLADFPASHANPLWRRFAWWVEWPLFLDETGREPSGLDEYVAWSQQRQAKALAIVAGRLKEKFPRCGGVIFWMGHDSFPCTANTSVLDFDGAPKPAALALAEIFKKGGFQPPSPAHKKAE